MTAPEPDRPAGPGAPPGGARPRRHRASVLLFLLVVIGMPFVVVGQLVGPEVRGLPFGPQPGGLIEGVVRDPQGKRLPGHQVELELVSSDFRTVSHAVVTTDAEGGFAVEAPSVDGKYRLTLGGGEHRRTYREVSFLDSRSRVVQPRPLDVELRRAAVVVLHFRRADGRAVTGGRATLSGTTIEGPLFGLLGYPLERTFKFEGETCVMDGLPPFGGTVQVVFNNGDTCRIELRASEGRREIAQEL